MYLELESPDVLIPGAENQRCAEEEADGEVTQEEHVFPHVDVPRAVNQICYPLQECADSLCGRVSKCIEGTCVRRVAL